MANRQIQGANYKIKGEESSLTRRLRARVPHTLSRRNVLRGLGVSLFLPWLETFAPRAHAQANLYPKRFLPIYFPNGAAADFWAPQTAGAGPEWQLSKILEPLLPVKKYLTIATNLENYSPFTPRVHDENQALEIGARPDSHVEPSHSLLCGAFMTCADPDAQILAGVPEPVSGISADQLIAQKLGAPTPFESLQYGLSTLNSDPDNRHPALTRSISWASPTEPLYKEVNPQAAFDRLVSVAPDTTDMDPEAVMAAQRRHALRQSSLDAILDGATSLQQKLSYSDRARLDQFLGSVRDLEQRADNVGDAMGRACTPRQRPQDAYGVGVVPADYDRGVHADLMNDLIVMAFECDLTRVVSYMLDDARSDFEYRHIQKRSFDGAVTTPLEGGVGSFHALQHAGDSNHDYASINWWLTLKVSELAQKLAAIPEGDGTVLDHMVMWYAAAMHGSDHDGFALPGLLIGGGEGTFKTDFHHAYPEQRDGKGAQFADLYWTIMQNYFGFTDVESFGSSGRIMTELLA